MKDCTALQWQPPELGPELCAPQPLCLARPPAAVEFSASGAARQLM